jgi:hypothetical protein
MKKILTITFLFVLTLILGIKFRNDYQWEKIKTGYEENDSDDDQKEIANEPFEKGEKSGKGEKENGPEEFIKFHLGIRTRSDQAKPGYPANYQWAELQKAQQSAPTKKSNSTARIQNAGDGVTGYTERGPGNVPGRTRGLIVDPDDATNKTWYAGSASGGIWKTIDAGSSWQWLTPSIPNLATTTLAMAASNHNTIYAGTGEGFGLVDGVNGNGIFISTNRGASWALLPGSVSLGSINRLAVDPSNASNVLAAANSGIWHSTDGGNSWTQVYNGLVQDLKPTPGNFSTLYAGLNGVGVLKSIDGGLTWNYSNTGMSPNGRVEIAVSPVKTNRIVASCEGSLSGVNSDLYLSDDGGVTWYLVTLTLGKSTVDYLSTQGWYDNTAAFSPYNQNVVYIGGVTAFQVTLGSSSATATGSYTLRQNNTSSFLTLVNFGASAAGGILDVGSGANQDTVQILFGPGLKQKAYRFLVPTGDTSGVPDSLYTYQDDTTTVPFQVWDVTKNQQLTVSFRDQDRNGVFDLLADNTTSSVATQQSREYIFINNVPYNASTPNPSIATSGGQAYQEMYMLWPELASGATWSPNSLPSSNLLITYQTVNKYTSTVSSVADPYDDYDGKNQNVHPDQHNIYPMVNSTGQTFQLLMANDGGVFLSGISASPGTTQGEWTKVGNGYNTSQFYGADKKPGAQEYLGGMQDNSTYFTPSGTISSATTYFSTNTQLSGDGFEVLWHTTNNRQMIGGAEYNYFSRSLDGGTTWTSAFSGFPLTGTAPNQSPDESKFPFISKLACSKQAPDIIYSVGSQGVWKSIDFGGSWALTPITTGWEGSVSSFIDVDVSRANANVVWAGGGMNSGTNLFVSTDAGATFNAVPNPTGVTLGNITRIATHPTNEKIAYALFSFAKTAKILMTKDLGQTWTDISGFGTGTSSTNGFPDVAVYSLYVRPDNTNIIWAGTEIGIIESLDDGTTWALNTEFPSVAVWDMKGQDNEVVIATHGRGIWTAELAVDQNGNYPVPVIVNSGTSPQSKFVLQAHLPYAYDSVQVVINSQTVKFTPPDSGVYNIQIANAPLGSLSIQLIAYKGDAPIYSIAGSGYNFSLLAIQQQYYDYFITTNNFYLSGGSNAAMSLQPWGASNSSLQSPHVYATNQDVSATLLVPIIVSSGSNTSLSYQDVAIVVPGTTGSVFGQSAFNDYVVVEATKDGVTWTPIANGYNASANATWLAAYTAVQSGAIGMSVTETFDLKNKFVPTDTLLIRFRLHGSNETTAAWGWSVDNLYIQQAPTGTEPVTGVDTFSAYPNPSSGKFTINYSLSAGSQVSMSVWDMAGRSIASQDLGLQVEGDHQFDLDLESSQDGIYLIRLKTNQEEKTTKVLLRK